MDNTRISQKAPNQFVIESDHELETHFSQVKFFDFEGKRYEIEGVIIAIQAIDPKYSFAYAASVKLLV